ncbi:hypothetical protein V1514DRAFT_328128, partial [Lipomyces japonicus]|uniref:uncharacterized protein n=1 Tax=Lipomyces japonicus TaxID=56871 RepID=UPI0034CE03D5
RFAGFGAFLLLFIVFLIIFHFRLSFFLFAPGLMQVNCILHYNRSRMKRRRRRRGEIHNGPWDPFFYSKSCIIYIVTYNVTNEY